MTTDPGTGWGLQALRGYHPDAVAGLDVVDPGLVSVAAWRDDQRAGTDRPADHHVGCYGVVAREPGASR